MEDYRSMQVIFVIKGSLVVINVYDLCAMKTFVSKRELKRWR